MGKTFIYRMEVPIVTGSLITPTQLGMKLTISLSMAQLMAYLKLGDNLAELNEIEGSITITLDDVVEVD